MKINTRALVLAGLLIALDVVSARFLFFYTPPLNADRISMQFIANAVAGLLFGPWLGALCAVLGDLVGMLINPAGMTFTPLITLACAVRGVIYGFLLHKRNIRAPRCVAAVAVVTVVVELGMMPWVLSALYGIDYRATLLAKLPWRALTIPVYGSVLFAVCKGLSRAGYVSPIKNHGHR